MSRMGEYALELQGFEDGHIFNRPIDFQKGLQPPVSAEFSGATPWVSLHQTAEEEVSNECPKESTSDAATV